MGVPRFRSAVRGAEAAVPTGGPKTRPALPAFLRGGLGLGGGGAETEEVTEDVTWVGSLRRFARRRGEER